MRHNDQRIRRRLQREDHQKQTAAAAANQKFPAQYVSIHRKCPHLILIFELNLYAFVLSVIRFVLRFLCLDGRRDQGRCPRHHSGLFSRLHSLPVFIVDRPEEIDGVAGVSHWHCCPTTLSSTSFLPRFVAR
jgi:hypothetical protein